MTRGDHRVPLFFGMNFNQKIKALVSSALEEYPSLFLVDLNISADHYKESPADLPELKGELAEKVQAVLENQINPAIASHGGAAQLIGVEGNDIYLRLGGGCQGCGMAQVTLTQGIEASLREAVPEIGNIIDATDHAAGENPYFASH